MDWMSLGILRSRSTAQVKASVSGCERECGLPSLDTSALMNLESQSRSEARNQHRRSRPCYFLAASQIHHLLNGKNTDVCSPYSFIQHMCIKCVPVCRHCGEACDEAHCLDGHRPGRTYGAVLGWGKDTCV